MARSAFVVQYKTFPSEVFPDGWANGRECKSLRAARGVATKLNKQNPGHYRAAEVEAIWED